MSGEDTRQEGGFNRYLLNKKNPAKAGLEINIYLGV